MAFCTNCGKSLEEGARFCTNCGTPAQLAPTSPPTAPSGAAAAAPAVATLIDPAVSAPQTPEAQPAIAAEPRVQTPANSDSVPYADFPTPHQSSTSPVFVIVCIVLLVLIGGGVAGTVYFQRQGKAKTIAGEKTPAETSQSSESQPSSSSFSPSSISSPAASTQAPATSEASPSSAAAAALAPPVPVAASIRAMNLGNYPGATPVAIATLTGETVVAGFLTRDTPQQVMQFYKIRFPISTTTENEGKLELAATLPGGERIRVQAQPQSSNTQVMVLQQN